MKKKLIANADSLVDKTLSCSRIKLSESQNFILEGLETGSFLLDFSQQIPCKNADLPDIYFTLFDADDKIPTLILNENA